MSAVAERAATAPGCNEGALRDLLGRTLERRRVPVTGNFELTLRCNLSCKHCYLGDDRSRAELAVEEVKRVVSEIAAAGGLMLTLTGGEPLLRPDFAEIYLHAQSQGFLLSVFTNATLITDEHVQLFTARPPRLIEISLYGLSDASYRSFTRRAASFATVDANIRKLVAARLPILLKTVATASLGGQVNAMRDYAASLGVPFRYATVVHDANDGSPHAASERPGSDAVCDLELGAPSLADLRAYDARPHLAQDDRVFSCGAGRVSYNIDPAGLLSRCGQLTGALARGVDLRRYSFQEGWEQLGNGLDATLPADHPCRTCAIRHLCNRCAATDSAAAQIAMCELAYARARRLGHEVSGPPPMKVYLRGADLIQLRGLRRSAHA